MPYLEDGDFLCIFIAVAMIGFAIMITLSEMEFLFSKWQVLRYVFWIVQSYSLYDLSQKIHGNFFTFEVLTITMLAYLFLLYFCFYLSRLASLTNATIPNQFQKINLRRV